MRFLAVVLSLVLSAPVSAEQLTVSEGTIQVDIMAKDLNAPWAVGFLPNGRAVITERGGRLWYLSADGRHPVSGLPKVHVERQGGLLDVVVAKDFATSREIFLSYVAAKGRRYGTTLAKARLSKDHRKLTNIHVLYTQPNKTGKTHHFGSRIVEARNGDLFLTVGDRGAPDLAQDPTVPNGKVIRVSRDGLRVSVHSIGHRNPQGAALDARGQLWTVEHGARGGDEVNKPDAGKNYGWPVISYGRHYSGLKIGDGTKKAGMEQPAFYWDPSIAPSGMMIYDGDMFPAWRGDIFVGSLKFDFIARLEETSSGLQQVEALFEDKFERIRDVRQAPDGSIWFLSVGAGALYRISR